MLDQVQPEARTLPLGSNGGVRQPDLGHQVEPPELGQDPAVDAVGLAGKRCQTPCLHGVGDSDVPAGELELVVHEPRAAHRLDYPEHGHIVQSLCEPGQTVAVGRHSTDRHALALMIERLPVEPFAAEIQSDVQHARGLPSSRRGRAEHHSAGGPPSSHFSARAAPFGRGLVGAWKR